MAYVNGWVAVLSALTIFGIRSVSAVPDIETQYAVDTALGVGQAELDRQKSINEYMFKTGNIFITKPCPYGCNIHFFSPVKLKIS